MINNICSIKQKFPYWVLRMKIAFHGAARTVTGSKHLITLKNGKKVTWWKQIGIPQNDYGDGIMWVQNHSLIPAENITSKKVLVDFYSLNKTGSISFWKAKLLGAHTPVSYKWNIMQALKGGCRVTLVWKKDSCL